MSTREKFLNTKRSNLSLLSFLVVLGVLITLFAVGAVLDLDICKSIWEGLGHQEVLGRVVSGTLCNIGFFFVFALIFSFAICSFDYRKDKIWVPILSCILTCAILFFFSYFQYDDFFPEIQKADKILNPQTDTSICWIFMALAWAINWAGSFIFAWYFICKRVNHRLMMRAGLFLAIGACLIMFGKEFWKVLWSRPRPSSIMEDSTLGLTFRPVWELHPFEALDESVPTEFRDQLKSFPSGHTSAAMLMVLSAAVLTSLDLFKSKKAKNIYLYVAIGLVALVALNRMIARCHFLTDVTGAAIIALVISYFMPWCYKRNNGKLLW